MLATLAETIHIADSYALGDPMQPVLNLEETNRKYLGNNGPWRGDRPGYSNKRREDIPDYRYGSNQVAALMQDQPDTDSSQRQKTNIGQAWGQNRDVARQWNR